MKKKGHPHYQEVLFVDSATGSKFVCGSTLQPKEVDTFNGKEYPVSRVPVSSYSHPFFTGSKQLVDAEGRVDKFNKRYASQGKAAAPTPTSTEAPAKPAAAEAAAPKKEKPAAKKAPAKPKKN